MAATHSHPAHGSLPAPPRSLRATHVDVREVVLGWKPAHGGTKAAGYEGLRGGRRIGTTRHHTFTDRHVRPGRSYRYAVRAVGAHRRHGTASHAIRVRVPHDRKAPTVPAGLGAVARSDAQIALNWRASRDNV